MRRRLLRGFAPTPCVSIAVCRSTCDSGGKSNCEVLSLCAKVTSTLHDKSRLHPFPCPCCTFLPLSYLPTPSFATPFPPFHYRDEPGFGRSWYDRSAIPPRKHPNTRRKRFSFPPSPLKFVYTYAEELESILWSWFWPWKSRRFWIRGFSRQDVLEHKRGREENFNVSVGKIAPKNIRFDSLFESLSSFFKNWRMEQFDA